MMLASVGPSVQRSAVAAASSAYLVDRRGCLSRPRELFDQAYRGQVSNGAMPAWEFNCSKKLVKVDAKGSLLVDLMSVNTSPTSVKTCNLHSQLLCCNVNRQVVLNG